MKDVFRKTMVASVLLLVLISCGQSGEGSASAGETRETREAGNETQDKPAGVTLDESNRRLNEYGHFSAIVPQTNGSRWSFGGGRNQQNVEFSVQQVVSDNASTMVVARFALFTEDIAYRHYADTGFADMTVEEKFEVAFGRRYDGVSISSEPTEVDIDGVTASVYDFTATIEDDGIDGRYNGSQTGFVAVFEKNGYSYVASGWYNNDAPEYREAPMKVLETIRFEFEEA